MTTAPSVRDRQALPFPDQIPQKYLGDEHEQDKDAENQNFDGETSHSTSFGCVFGPCTEVSWRECERGVRIV